MATAAPEQIPSAPLFDPEHNALFLCSQGKLQKIFYIASSKTCRSIYQDVFNNTSEGLIFVIFNFLSSIDSYKLGYGTLTIFLSTDVKLYRLCAYTENRHQQKRKALEFQREKVMILQDSIAVNSTNRAPQVMEKVMVMVNIERIILSIKT